MKREGGGTKKGGLFEKGGYIPSGNYVIGFVAAIVVKKAANAAIKFIYLVLVWIYKTKLFCFSVDISTCL